MKVNYELKSKFLLTPEELEELDWLHYEDGQMFKYLIRKDKIGMVILAKNGDGLILSWGLIFERDDTMTYFCWTRKDYRRQGIGAALWKIAVDSFGNNFSVSRHNIQAKRFYDSVGA